MNRKRITISVLLFLLAFTAGVESRIGILGVIFASTRHPELRQLTKYDTFPKMAVFFKSVARNKGAVYAFDLLREADLPPNMDVHLLGHTIGDVLYREKGIEGIRNCTQEFRNACSHSIVVGYFLEKGEDALPTIADVCRRAPGGKGAYTMCLHGLGHGILAAVDYDLPRGVSLCAKTRFGNVPEREESECIGGQIMEILSGGQFNPELWAVEQKKYFKDDDPLYPCSADFIPDSAKIICYDYLTPRLMEYAGMDFGNPDETLYPKAFELCDRIPAIDVLYRQACFGGFGKEFVALVQQRDFRKINSMSDRELSTIHTWCSYAGQTERVTACVVSASNSLYWGGENDFRITVRFCELSKSDSVRNACMGNFFQNVSYYAPSDSYKRSVCRSVPVAYEKNCLASVFP